MKRIIRSAVTLGAAMAAAVGLLGMAAAGSTSGAAGHRPSGSQLQLAADAVANRLDALVARAHVPGFAGEEVLPSEPGPDVYWHGRPPAMVARLTLDAARSRGVTVRFLPAPYSLAQLVKFRSEINNEPGFAQAGISIILIYPQATGLYIGVADGSARARSMPVIARSRIPVHFYRAKAVPLGSPRRVRIRHVLPLDFVSRGLPASSMLPGRWKDVPPFSGGDFIYAKYANLDWECSSGFAMHFANKPSTYFMLTAGHCIAHKDLGTQPFWIEGNGLRLGTTFDFQANDDAVSLLPPSRTDDQEGFIYTGGTSTSGSGGEGIAAVKGASSVHAGDVVSQSGAWSGERTGIKVSTTEAEWGLEGGVPEPV